jgi:hypothetical protein
MVDLDTRARAAAAGLRTAAGQRPRPGWEPPGARHGHGARRPRPAFVLATVTAVIAVVAAAAVVAVTHTGDDDEVVPTQAGGVPTLIPDVVPDGLTALGALDLPREPEAQGAERLTESVYGDPAAPDPFAGAELGVSVLRSEGADAIGDSPLTVRGHSGWATVESATGRHFVTWEEASGVLASVTSATVPQAELIAVAEGLTFSADYTHVDATVLPPGLSLVGSLDDVAFTGALTPVVLPAETPGHLVGYGDPVGHRAVSVATFGIEPDELTVLKWGLGEPAGEVTVRGHTGLLHSQPTGSADGGPLLSVLWEEQPGVFCIVAGDVDQAALLATAESLHPATEAQWADLLALGDEIIISED